MCEFISWIEKDDKVVFLTGDDVFKSKRGKQLRAYMQADDVNGHGAIRWYYNFTGGKDRECVDFSSPNNFPAEIVVAIKSGKMRGMGTAKCLLTPATYAEYEKIEQLASAEYEKIRQEAYAEYEKIQQPAYAEYKKIKQEASAEYEKIRQEAYAEYKKIEQPASAEYEKIKQTMFWDLFSESKNRNKKWI